MEKKEIDLVKTCLMGFFFESVALLLLSYLLGPGSHHFVLLAICAQPLIVLASIISASSISLKISIIISLSGIIPVAFSISIPNSNVTTTYSAGTNPGYDQAPGFVPGSVPSPNPNPNPDPQTPIEAPSPAAPTPTTEKKSKNSAQAPIPPDDTNSMPSPAVPSNPNMGTARERTTDEQKENYKKRFLMPNIQKFRDSLNANDCKQVRYLMSEMSKGGIQPSDLPNDIDLTKCK